MNDTGSFVAAVLRELAASTAVILAAWGALGGATNALTTKMRLRDALRHILLGGLIAAGMGSLSMAVITAWLSLPPEAIPAGGAAGSAAYLVGVFGPAFIEMLLARLRRNLELEPLAGFVSEGFVPYGSIGTAGEAVLRRAMLSGMPVVKVLRGNAEGIARPPRDLAIRGSNLTATKARLLLMACLMRFGSLPPAADPEHPTPQEIEAVRAKLAQYQEVFDTH